MAMRKIDNDDEIYSISFHINLYLKEKDIVMNKYGFKVLYQIKKIVIYDKSKYLQTLNLNIFYLIFFLSVKTIN